MTEAALFLSYKPQREGDHTRSQCSCRTSTSDGFLLCKDGRFLPMNSARFKRRLSVVRVGTGMSEKS